MKFSKKKIIFAIVCILFFASIQISYAGPISDAGDIEAQQNAFVQGSGFDPSTGSYSLSGYMANLIKVFLGILGVVFIILVIVAGFNWMTAGGDEEKVKKAKQMIQRAIIGLIIIALAYSITYFVFKSLPGGTGTGGSGGSSVVTPAN
ncbi:MAG: hypothetical protein U9R06_00480 [Patescibacteria group bacterium]|nr:hypothetical protein [Patescibacteria group bacterium]